ncbi:MAG TPA: DUF4340 domain-containing protein [Burkholderiales bacterium]|nr:DUF4340 domain-containing protein [Burkholderiales bacterium]
MGRLFRINAALLALVAALALFAWFHPHRDAPDYPLSALKAADVTSIRIEPAGGAPLALARSAAGWNITTPLAARVDGFQVQRMLAVLGATARDRLPAADLGRFNLTPPLLRLTVDGQTFDFGMVNELTREQYVLTQGYVYLCKPSYGLALPRDVTQLVSRQLFAENETPVAFEFPDFRLTQYDGRWTLSPSPRTALSQDDIDRWVDDWRYASALAMRPAGKNPAPETIKVRLQDGRTLTLGILQHSPQLTLLRDDQPALAYQFTDDIARRLLAPPGAALEPQINMDEHR